MKIQQQGETLCISEIKELGAADSSLFRNEALSLPPSLKTIEIDLSQTNFIDSCGLGALVALHKSASSQNHGIIIRLLNPTPPVQQIFELTRMHHLFEIVNH